MIQFFIILLLSLLYIINKKETFITQMKLSSNSFNNNEVLHKKYICEDKVGLNYSPHFSWENINDSNIKSYSLLFEDLDAPHVRDTNWTHWLVPFIEKRSGNSIHLTETISDGKSELLIGQSQINIRSGINSWDIHGYRGPCPPKGSSHKYKITVYALDIIIKSNKYNRKTFLEKINNHILYKGELHCTYQTN